MRKVYLITFGVGPFEKSKWRLAKQAEETGWFDKVIVYGESDVKQFYHAGRKQKHSWHPFSGFCWWKPYIQQMTMDKIENDDIYLYLDAGCSINKNGGDRFYEYLELCDNSPGLICFGGSSTDVSENVYTKRDLLKFLDCDKPEYFNHGQIGGGIYFAKKNELSLSFLSDYKKICDIDHLINNDKSYHEEYPEFLDHRHDQSVLSLLIKSKYTMLKAYLQDLAELDPALDPELKHPIQITRMDDNNFNL